MTKLPETVHVTLTLEFDLNTEEWVTEYGLEPTQEALKEDLKSYFEGSQPYYGTMAAQAVCTRVVAKSIRS